MPAQFTPAQRKKIYNSIVEDILKPTRRASGICYYLWDYIDNFDKGIPDEPWGCASCRPFPELCLFAFSSDDIGANETGYFSMGKDDELRATILFFCAHMID